MLFIIAIIKKRHELNDPEIRDTIKSLREILKNPIHNIKELPKGSELSEPITFEKKPSGFTLA